MGNAMSFLSKHKVRKVKRKEDISLHKINSFIKENGIVECPDAYPYDEDFDIQIHNTTFSLYTPPKKKRKVQRKTLNSFVKTEEKTFQEPEVIKEFNTKYSKVLFVFSKKPNDFCTFENIDENTYRIISISDKLSKEFKNRIFTEKEINGMITSRRIKILSR